MWLGRHVAGASRPSNPNTAYRRGNRGWGVPPQHLSLGVPPQRVPTRPIKPRRASPASPQP